MPEVEHIPTCAQLEYVPCGGPNPNHRWSGWPGAYCLDCGEEDKNEICLAGCSCPCHDELWASYDRWYEEHQDQARENDDDRVIG
jgi:hypothetical protein